MAALGAPGAGPEAPEVPPLPCQPFPLPLFLTLSLPVMWPGFDLLVLPYLPRAFTKVVLWLSYAGAMADACALANTTAGSLPGAFAIGLPSYASAGATSNSITE